MAAERIAHVLLQHVGKLSGKKRNSGEKKYIQEELVRMLKHDFSVPKQ